MRSTSLPLCKGSALGSVRLSGLLHLQTSSASYRLVTTRLVGFGADGLHPLLDDAAITNCAGGDGPLTEPLPYQSDVRCRLEHTERLGRTLERDAAAAEGESTGSATLVNTGDEERNAKIPWQRGSNQTKIEAVTSSVAAVAMDGLVAETPLAGAHVKRTFSEMSLTSLPFFRAVQVNANSLDKTCCSGGCDFDRKRFSGWQLGLDCDVIIVIGCLAVVNGGTRRVHDAVRVEG